MANAESEEPSGPSYRIDVPLPLAGGVWSNWATVSESDHEFTIDFARIDHSQEPPPARGVLVARVAFSSKLLAELVQVLQETWDRYAAQALHEALNDESEDHRTVQMMPEEPRPERLLGVQPGPRVATTHRKLSKEAQEVIRRDRANEVQRLRQRAEQDGRAR